MGDEKVEVPGYLLEGQLHQSGDRWYVFHEEGKTDLSDALEQLAGRDVRVTAIALEDIREVADELRRRSNSERVESDSEDEDDAERQPEDP